MMEALQQLYHAEEISWLEDYCRTAPVQRLRQVGMNCGCEYTSFPLFAGLKPYSRYDHSLGVARIVWHFTGSRSQTVAALLHDVATPVFAHVIDFLQGDHLTQEATEAGTAARIAESAELRGLLKRDGLSLEAVSDYHQYPVADNEAPALSADRLEYTMGNLLNYGLLTLGELEALYRQLSVGKNEAGAPELVFQTADAAAAFARAALKTSWIYMAPEDRYAMQLLAELLRTGLSSGVLQWEELWTTEPEVLAKIARAPALWKKWQTLCGYRRVREAESPDGEGVWRQVPAKRRWIDPLASGCGRVSDWDTAFHEETARLRRYSFENWICGQS